MSQREPQDSCVGIEWFKLSYMSPHVIYMLIFRALGFPPTFLWDLCHYLSFKYEEMKARQTEELFQSPTAIESRRGILVLPGLPVLKYDIPFCTSQSLYMLFPLPGMRFSTLGVASSCFVWVSVYCHFLIGGFSACFTCNHCILSSILSNPVSFIKMITISDYVPLPLDDKFHKDED